MFTGPERPQLGLASLFLRFLFRRFLGLEEKGWIHPGREWGCGSGESEFVERSPDFGRGRTRSQQQRGQERTDHRDPVKHYLGELN